MVPALAALACSLALTTAALAADPPSGDRSTPGTVAPSTGVTAVEPPPAPAASSVPSRPAPVAKAGSLSGPPPSECAALRQAYARSQACFAPYRLANGGLKPEAAGRCTEVANPATKCGPEIVAPK